MYSNEASENFLSPFSSTTDCFVVDFCFHCSYSDAGEKISLPVNFPLEALDSRDFTQTSLSAAAGAQGSGEHVYDLLGCVCHKGGEYYITSGRSLFKSDHFLNDDRNSEIDNCGKA